MEIKKIEVNDVEEYCQLQLRAYPSMRFNSKAEWDSFVERTGKSLDNEEHEIFGSFIGNQLVGSLMLYHYQINYLGEWLPVEGIGSVAVDLLHKREGICREMMAWAENTILEKNISLSFLFPFRPDFYIPMGYGYGPTLYHYEIDPSQIPNKGDKSKIIYLTNKDIPQIRGFEEKLSIQMHGYVKKQDREMKDYFDRLSWQKIGFFQDNQLEGWMVFHTKQPDPKNFLRHHLYIYEWWNATISSRLSFLSFLYSQKDQYEKIIYNSIDPSLIHALKDPRDDNQKLVPPFISHSIGQLSTSIFYSVLDPEKLMKKIIKYQGPDRVVPFDWEIQKPFPEDHQERVSWVGDEKSTKNRPMLSTTQPVASSILMGSLTLKQAITWNLIKISDENQLDKLDDFLRIPVPYGTPNF
jgi:predicted N-acetyltransferase YhbS